MSLINSDKEVNMSETYQTGRIMEPEIIYPEDRKQNWIPETVTPRIVAPKPENPPTTEYLKTQEIDCRGYCPVLGNEKAFETIDREFWGNYCMRCNGVGEILGRNGNVVMVCEKYHDLLREFSE